MDEKVAGRARISKKVAAIDQSQYSLQRDSKVSKVNRRGYASSSRFRV
jgi:hypothetical protein